MFEQRIGTLFDGFLAVCIDRTRIDNIYKRYLYVC